MKSLTEVLSGKVILAAFLSLVIFSACQKEKQLPQDVQSAQLKNSLSDQGHLKQTKTFSSDVVVSWINQQLQMVKLPLPAGTLAQPTNERLKAYCGIALYEGVVSGMPAYQSLSGQLTDFQPCHLPSQVRLTIGQPVPMQRLQK